MSHVTPGSPAEGSLSEYDLITEIQDSDAKSMSHQDSVLQVRKCGLSVKLKVRAVLHSKTLPLGRSNI